MNKESVMHLLRKPIAFHPIFSELTGSVKAGLFLSQLFYWSDKGSGNDGWIYKTQEEWRAETTLTRREQESARSDLRSMGYLEEKRAGNPARLYYRINLSKIMADLDKRTKAPIKNGAKRQSSMSESANLDCTKAPIKNGAKRQSPITENTYIEYNREYTENTYIEKSIDPDERLQREREFDQWDMEQAG